MDRMVKTEGRRFLCVTTLKNEQRILIPIDSIIDIHGQEDADNLVMISYYYYRGRFYCEDVIVKETFNDIVKGKYIVEL